MPARGGGCQWMIFIRQSATDLLHDACFSFGESDVTPGLVLDELDLDLSAASLLVGLGLLVIVVVVAARLDGVVVGDEGVVWGVLGGGVLEAVDALPLVGEGGRGGIWGWRHGWTGKGSRDWVRGVGIGLVGVRGRGGGGARV